MRRGGRSGGPTVARRQDLGEPRRRPVAVADLQQRADEVAHHVVEEAAALHDEVEAAGSLHDVRVVQRPHGAALARVARIARERGEVVATDEAARRLAHRRDVDRPAHPVEQVAADRRPHGRRDAAVGVAFAARVEARVEAVGRADDALDGDVVGQVGVERQQQALGREVARDRRVRALAQRVDAGIGAAGAFDVRLRTADRRERLLQDLLDRAEAGLPLPAVEGRAVVGDGQQIRRHGADDSAATAAPPAARWTSAGSGRACGHDRRAAHPRRAVVSAEPSLRALSGAATTR